MGVSARGDGVSAARVGVQGDTPNALSSSSRGTAPLGARHTGSLGEATAVRTRPGHDERGCEGSDLGVARHRGGTGSSTLSIQTFQAHTDGEGSGRISEGGAYG